MTEQDSEVSPIISAFEVRVPTDDYETRIIYPKIKRRRVNFYLNLVVKSSRIKRITIRYPDGTVSDLPRSNLHALLCGPKGVFKSSTLDQIRKVEPDHVILKDSVSYAALVGSIDSDTKESNIPLAIRADGKILLMDEVVRDEKGYFTKAMNQFMERGEYSRDVAITPKNRRTVVGDTRWSVENGEITIKSKFSVIMATMMSPDMISRTMIGAGFVDRMIVLWIDSTPEEREKYFENPTPLYEDLGFNPPSTVEISLIDYQRIFDFWRKNDSEREARRLGDCIRCFAVLGYHDETTYKELIVLGTPKVMQVARRRH